jgi:hypothetical protein
MRIKAFKFFSDHKANTEQASEYIDRLQEKLDNEKKSDNGFDDVLLED